MSTAVAATAGSASPQPTVYVVDDDPSTRRLLSWLMEREGVRTERFATAETFLDAFRIAGPCCLVLDLKLAGMNGLALQQQLNDRGIDLPIVFVSGTAQIDQAVTAVKHGAVDFVVKPFDYKKLVTLIHGCLQRSARSLEQRRDNDVTLAHLAALTPREREVMECVVSGKPNRIIAEELAVSIKTVEVHRARVMEKLGVHSLAELVRLSMALDASGARRPH